MSCAECPDQVEWPGLVSGPLFLSEVAAAEIIDRRLNLWVDDKDEEGASTCYDDEKEFRHCLAP
ncbi:hypothetical protein ROS1_57950 [Roseibium sp. ROS1]